MTQLSGNISFYFLQRLNTEDLEGYEGRKQVCYQSYPLKG